MKIIDMEYITEAEALADIEESRDDFEVEGAIDWYGSYRKFLEVRSDSIESDYEHYLCNKNAKVGVKITCAENRCKNRFIKKSYQQAFCCTKHKNQFWNRQRINER